MNTALQAYDPENQRLALLQQYNPHDHIVQWMAFNKQKNRSELVNYYPASWRLYELNLKYPTAKFDIDIIHMDIERDFCIVRARLYLGKTFETSPRRAVAHKQGKLTQLDKVETQAKARAARDMGVSTELALDVDDGQIVGEVVASTTVIDEEAPVANEVVSEVANETPRQLPEATNVEIPQPTSANVQMEPVPANVQPMRPNVQPQPPKPAQPAAQESKLLPGQFNALKSLYLRLNQEIPPDLDTWSFQQAAATITGLQAKLKQAS